MSDRTIDLLVGFEERFERHGHDIEMKTISPTTIGESRLRCKRCGEEALVATTNDHGAWYLPETRLDLGCQES